MKNELKEKIDMVILWVDSNDEKWLKEKNIYINSNNDLNRYRDCGN